MHQLCEREVGNRNGMKEVKEKHVLSEYLEIGHLWNHDTLNHSVIDNEKEGVKRKGRYSPVKNDSLVRKVGTYDLTYGVDNIDESYLWNHNTLNYSVIDIKEKGESSQGRVSPTKNGSLVRILSLLDVRSVNPYGFNINDRVQKNRSVNKIGFGIGMILMPVRDSRVHSLLVSWIRRLPPTHPPPEKPMLLFTRLESY